MKNTWKLDHLGVPVWYLGKFAKATYARDPNANVFEMIKNPMFRPALFAVSQQSIHYILNNKTSTLENNHVCSFA